MSTFRQGLEIPAKEGEPKKTGKADMTLLDPEKSQKVGGRLFETDILSREVL
jgi:hypothetical protein